MKMNTYRDEFVRMTSSDPKLVTIGEEVKSKFSTEDVKPNQGKPLQYLDYHFKGFPLIASITKITLLQSSIKNIEAQKGQFENTNFNVIEKFDKLSLLKNEDSKISSFLTVQEGCDKFCKFCVVPYTRGPEHSRNFNDIIKEADQLISNGSKEITLIGQNVNAYQFENKRLSDILIKLKHRLML